MPSFSKLSSSLFSTSAHSRRSIYYQKTCLDVEEEENQIDKFELSIIVATAEKFAAILRERESERGGRRGRG